MTHPNPGKDTREQARALVEPFEKADRTTVYLNWGILRDQIAAALSRARREGMEEAAGIAERYSQEGDPTHIVIASDMIAAAIRRAAKEVDRG